MTITTDPIFRCRQARQNSCTPPSCTPPCSRIVGVVEAEAKGTAVDYKAKVKARVGVAQGQQLLDQLLQSDNFESSIEDDDLLLFNLIDNIEEQIQEQIQSEIFDNNDFHPEVFDQLDLPSPPSNIGDLEMMLLESDDLKQEQDYVTLPPFGFATDKEVDMDITSINVPSVPDVDVGVDLDNDNDERVVASSVLDVILQEGLEELKVPKTKSRKKQSPVPEFKKNADYNDFRDKNNKSARKSRIKERTMKKSKKLYHKQALERNKLLLMTVSNLQKEVDDLKKRKQNQLFPPSILASIPPYIRV
eukprot:m.35085 g.35085  ORF g.35085 m.35085 type:complete len:304 (-) comp17083_c0_seq1:220-1131(-)